MSNWEPTVGSLSADELKREFGVLWTYAYLPSTDRRWFGRPKVNRFVVASVSAVETHVHALMEQLADARAKATGLLSERDQYLAERDTARRIAVSLEQELAEKDAPTPEPFGGYNTDPDAEAAAMRAQGEA